MAMKEKYLANLYSRTGNDAVFRANQTYTEIRALPLIERISAAKDLPDVFLEAIIIDRGDSASEYAARARIKSYFYVNSILKVDRTFHPIRRARTWLMERITLNLPRKLYIPTQPTFQGVSSPTEAQSLSSELKVMLKTIQAAHAPTAAKERSSLQSISI